MQQPEGLSPLVLLATLALQAGAARATPDAGTPDAGAGEEPTYDELLKEDDRKVDPENYYIGEVIVTGRRIANIEQAGTTTIVDGEEIGVHGDRSLATVLDRIPGVQTYTHTKGHTRVRMRGFDQDKVVVLVDGVPLNDVYSTDVDISTIPVLNISKIVVNRGVSSALYGTDGAIGTINIITRKPSEMTAAVDAEYGLYNNATLNLAHGAPVGDFFYFLTGTLQHSDGFAPSKRLDRELRREWFDKLIRYDLYPRDAPFGTSRPLTFDDVTMPSKEQYLGDRGLWDHHEYTRYNATAKLGYAFRPELEAGVSSFFSWFEGRTSSYEPYALSSYRGDRWKPNYPFFGDEQEEAKKMALRNRAFVWPYSYQFDVSPYLRWHIGDFSVKLVTFYLQHGTKQDGYAAADHSLTKGESVLLKPDGIFEPFHDLKTFRSAGFKLFPSYRFSRWHRLNLAVHFRHDTYLGEEQAISREVSPATWALEGGRRYPVEDLAGQIFSLGIEDELRLWDRLKLTAGVSYDVQNFARFEALGGEGMEERYIVKDEALLMGTRDSFNPVVGLVFDPVKRLLRLRAAGAMKTRFPTLGEYAKIEEEDLDAGLEPERSYNMNAGAELSFLDRAVRLRSDYFASVIDDKIVKLHKEEPPVNIERVVVQGVESAVEVELGRSAHLGGLRLIFAHVYLHARNRDYSDDETANKGDLLELTPEHELIFDLRLDFASQTTLDIWATATVNQVLYAMESRPTEIESAYSTSYFAPVRLHDPLFLNVRVAQRFLTFYEASVAVHNVTDDYRADPFNPGPGRMIYLGLAAEWH